MGPTLSLRAKLKRRLQRLLMFEATLLVTGDPLRRQRGVTLLSLVPPVGDEPSSPYRYICGNGNGVHPCFARRQPPDVTGNHSFCTISQ